MADHKNRIVLYLSALLLLACLMTGFTLARHRSTWNDEIYNQVSIVHNRTYWEVLTNRDSQGNICPLSYILQKAINDLAGFQTPKEWLAGNWDYDDVPSRIVLRIFPVVFMSLSIAAIFYFFSRFYSLGTGVFSLFLSLSSFMVWAYWAEARVYAKWVFLTTIQSLVFLRMVPKKEGSPGLWRGLTIVHFLMAFTIPFSLAQIGIISFLLFCYGYRSWRAHILLTIVPALIAFIYYALAPQYPFWFSLTPEQLVRECLSRDRVYILYIYGLFFALYGLQQRYKNIKIYKNDRIKDATPYFGITVLMILAAWAVLAMFKLKANTIQAGFPVNSRYFIYLTPVGIIAVTLFTVSLLRAFSGRIWMQLIVFSGIGYFTVARMLKVIVQIKQLYPELFP